MRFRKLRIAWSLAWCIAAVILGATALYRQIMFERSPYVPYHAYSDYREYGRWSLFVAGIALLTLLPMSHRFTTRDLLVAVILISIALGLVLWAWNGI